MALFPPSFNAAAGGSGTQDPATAAPTSCPACQSQSITTTTRNP